MELNQRLAPVLKRVKRRQVLRLEELVQGQVQEAEAFPSIFPKGARLFSFPLPAEKTAILSKLSIPKNLLVPDRQSEPIPQAWPR